VPENDDDLIRECLQGSAAAGEALVEAYWNRVFAYSFRLTFNRSEAEDITQETFLKAFSSLGSYTPGGQLKAWLFRIATNLFLDLKKSPRRRDVGTDEVDADEHVQTAPDDSLERSELLSSLHQAIKSLSEEQRVVVMLRAMERLDYEQIAGILKMNEATARWHMYEARRALRKKLSQHFDLGGLGDE
jgi:RNA polymerase sigma-70 factor, ECF subfamily